MALDVTLTTFAQALVARNSEDEIQAATAALLADLQALVPAPAPAPAP
jgi:hypothetical protein